LTRLTLLLSLVSAYIPSCFSCFLQHDGKFGTVQIALSAFRAVIGFRYSWKLVSLAVELVRKLIDFLRAKLDAKAAALAEFLVYANNHFPCVLLL
jgi:hypothetical protein